MDFGVVFKWALTLLVGLDTFAIALVSSAYSGSTNEIIAEFRISEEIALLGISLFVVGFAVGPLIWHRSARYMAVDTFSLGVGSG
ncbi:hypothetical protein N7481_000255 [Penicillium waksmanii]|uniref:uncharacterized protein n=1 Tax=Penicillium waksmanii TaxID=69791 RepID=UPI00254982C9|nr:uncharacterized protein N7481_000255 [Penicillium waksmanii]KAJ5999846.1 hypothetical protein N7481_000255 [Penicillium waksmanii]